MEFIVLPDAFFYCPIGIGLSALSIEVIIPEITDLFVAIGKGKGALSVEVAIPEFTDVFVAIGKGAGAKAVMFILVLV